MTPDAADRPGGGHRPHAGRAPGRDRAAHLLRARHPRAVPRSGLLSHAGPAPLRRPRVRRPDLRAGHRPPRPRLPVDRVAGLPAHGARAAGRRVVRRARPGRAVRRSRLPVPVGGGPGRQGAPDRRRLPRAHRHPPLLLGRPVRHALPRPDAPGRRRPADAVRRSAQRVDDARRLGAHAGPQGQRLQQHRLRRRPHPGVLRAARHADARTSTTRAARPASACTATRCTSAAP